MKVPMSFVISSVMPFPNIEWWCHVSEVSEVVWEMKEYFEKMSFRNRYYIAAGNGLLKMSVPILGGREHKSLIEVTNIAYKEGWQRQHWRTLESAYRNAPYFDFYAHSLQALFVAHYERLYEFNLATVHWLKEQLKLSFNETSTTDYRKHYSEATDLRTMKYNGTYDAFPPYYQLFRERNGFLPNMSMLDLLFAEGPYALSWLKHHRAGIAGEKD